MKTNRERYDEQFAKVQEIRLELANCENVYHKRQPIKHRLEIAELELRVCALQLDNEKLMQSGIATAVAPKVRYAHYQKDSAEEGLRGAANDMIYRLRKAAEQLEGQRDGGYYDNLVYTLLNELPVIIGNSSFSSIARYAADRAAALKIIELSETEE